MCVTGKFDPNVESNGRIKGLTVVKYIEHIKELQKKYEAHDVPPGIDALFSEELGEKFYVNSFVPSEPIECDEHWFVKEKERGYSMKV